MPETATVSVVGTGIVDIEPDTLVIRFGSEARAASVRDALARCSSAMTAMVDAVRAAGVADSDRQTGPVSVETAWRPDGPSNEFSANQSLTVRGTTVEQAGELITAVTLAGGDGARVHGTSWHASRVDEMLPVAREAAVADARDKAARYAALLGRGLGAVVRIEEGGNAGARRAGARSAGVALESASLSMEPGRNEVRVSVEMTWELLP
ncbi:MAG: SIMPL domain-containing protein [Mycobacteriales bacterium]